MPKGEGAQDAAKKAVAVKAAASRPQSDSVQQAKKDSKAIAKAATPNAREDRATPAKIVPKSDGVQEAQRQSQNKKIADTYKEAGPAYKGAGQITWYPPANTNVDPIKDGTGNGDGKGKDLIKDDDTTTVSTISKSSGLVDDVNFKEEYFAEVKRIVLALIHNAKDLLMRYNFSTIDSVADYYLDADREAKSQAVLSRKARPEPPFGPQEALQQDNFSFSVNSLNNKINESVSDLDKINYFGTQRGDTFYPQRVRISSGIAYYDMRITFDSIYDQNNFVVKCYEIS
jgi:hypothetical protein